MQHNHVHIYYIIRSICGVFLFLFEHVQSHSDLSVFLEVMKHQHAPAAPVYIMTLISSIFALTRLGDVRPSLV